MSDPHALREGEAFDGPERTLTRADFDQFSGLTGDRHPIHHDAEYAKATRFGQPVAHGLHLAALTALGASTGAERSHGFVLVEQGTQFVKPAVAGDTLRSRLVVERLWKEEGRRFCRLKTELYNQRGERVLEGFHLYRLFDPPQPGKVAP